MKEDVKDNRCELSGTVAPNENLQGNIEANYNHVIAYGHGTRRWLWRIAKLIEMEFRDVHACTE